MNVLNFTQDNYHSNYLWSLHSKFSTFFMGIASFYPHNNAGKYLMLRNSIWVPSPINGGNLNPELGEPSPILKGENISYFITFCFFLYVFKKEFLFSIFCYLVLQIHLYYISTLYNIFIIFQCNTYIIYRNHLYVLYLYNVLCGFIDAPIMLKNAWF